MDQTVDANAKIFLIPQIRTEALAVTGTLQNVFKNLARLLRRRRVLKQGDVCEFEEFYELVLADLQGQEDSLIKQYFIEKQEYWDKIQMVLRGEELMMSQRIPEEIPEEVIEPQANQDLKPEELEVLN